MIFDLVIQNGTVVTSAATFQADVGVRDGKIAAFGQRLEGERVIDATDMLVTPGAVDIHVHMQMSLGDGVVSADTFLTGTRAAAFGGTTAIVDFVEVEPQQSMIEALHARQAEADPQVVIDYALHMTLGPDEISKLDQLPAVAAAGITSYKLYMAYGFRLTDDQLYRALRAVRDVGGMPVIHAENWDIINALVADNLAAGRTSSHWHPRSRPALFEGEAAGRAIDIAAYVGTPLHIFHVSCREVVAKIAAARRQGLPITGETCPQYLNLTWEAYDAPGGRGAYAVCSPPIRDRSQQQALWQALARGELQVVTTDHCPFSAEDKARGRDDYSQIPGGVPSIEMRFASMYSGGVVTGRLTPNQWVDLCCTTPAKIANLAGKGDLIVGYDADIVIFDPGQKRILSPETLHENVSWTPYNGLEIQGWPKVTISRGEVIVHDGRFFGKPGRGQFIFRKV